MSEKEIKVVGMHCPSCVTAVELCLKDVDGINDAKADLDTGITKITLSADVSDADINEAVEEAKKLDLSALAEKYKFYRKNTRYGKPI